MCVLVILMNYWGIENNINVSKNVKLNKKYLFYGW